MVPQKNENVPDHDSTHTIKCSKSGKTLKSINEVHNPSGVLHKNVVKSALGTRYKTMDGKEDAATFKIPDSTRAKMLEVFDKCEFFCRICSEEHYSHYKLARHLLMAHEMAHYKGSIYGQSLKIKERYGRPVSKVVRLKCQLCFKDIMHTYNAVYSHLKGLHNVSVVDYYNQYMVPGKSSNPYRLKVTNGNKDSLLTNDTTTEDKVAAIPQSENGAIEEEDVDLNKKKDNTTETKEHCSLVCCSALDDESNEEQIPQEFSVTKREVKLAFDKCEFVCQICAEKHSCHSVLSNHLKKAHFGRYSSVAQYKETYGSLMTKVVMGNCRICLMEMKHTYDSYRGHLKRHHKMTTEEYYQKFLWGRIGRSEDEEGRGDLKIQSVQTLKFGNNQDCVMEAENSEKDVDENNLKQEPMDCLEESV